ncbi:hypothetical protein C8J56DRAFT_1041446 [Mycena floridula]|nr:hypothetical protein C8J56DRAFT_1041446 [Mycena floridula]
MVVATLPEISISLAPPNEPLAEPFSPFAWDSASYDDEPEDDSFRPNLLTPPPTHMRFGGKQQSPLRSSPPKGLQQDRFEALLKASRERNSTKSDLRKEIALKTHVNKQVQRRALFLSKVLAPPSPTATSLPKTPPESPAIFHYTLPSPGLVSPLALFESLNSDNSFGHSIQPWVEQVDFRLPSQKQAHQPVFRAHVPGKSLPSLDQISARLSAQAPTIRREGFERAARLPAFLSRPQSAKPAPERPRMTIGVGRLQMPLRTSKGPALIILPPKSPCSPLSPQLQVTTLRVPRSSTLSPTEFSESNVLALDSQSRERKAQAMLSTIRRRMVPSDLGINGRDIEDLSEMERRSRRQSAPADLMHPAVPSQWLF